MSSKKTRRTKHTVDEYPVRYDKEGRPLAYRDDHGTWRLADYWRYSKEPPAKVQRILDRYPPRANPYKGDAVARAKARKRKALPPPLPASERQREAPRMGSSRRQDANPGGAVTPERGTNPSAAQHGANIAPFLQQAIGHLEDAEKTMEYDAPASALSYAMLAFSNIEQAFQELEYADLPAEQAARVRRNIEQLKESLSGDIVSVLQQYLKRSRQLGRRDFD